MSSDNGANVAPRDWGTKGIARWTTTLHSDPYDLIDPAKVQFPKPFVVCVVGASRGIGAGIAESYAKAGASGIVLASRRVSGLEETAAKCGTNAEVEVIPCDITSAEDVAALAERCKARFGRLDVVVVNSGYSGPVILDIRTDDPKTVQNAINVNYMGTYLVAKYIIPLLLDTPNGAKAFVAVSSIAAGIVRGPIANAQYCVSKGAQLKLMENIHEQFQGQGLASYAVHPGAVRTEMAEESAPEVFMAYLTESPHLCGAFIVYLTKPEIDVKWLSGRLLSATWDVEQLLARKDEIVEKDLFKLQLSC